MGEHPKLQTNEHRHEVSVPLPVAEIARIFDARPSSWLNSFLRLASVWAGSSTRPTAPPWFRLGNTVADVDQGTVHATFVWWPHLGDDVFDSFRGRFVARPARDGSALALEGTLDGGNAATNSRVLDALVETLGSALGAGQEPDG